MKKIQWPLVFLSLLFLFTLGFRLYFAYQSPSFASDTAYFHLGHIDQFLFEREFSFYDELSYGGREILYPPFFPLLMSLLSFGSVFFLKFFSEFFLASLVFIVYLLCKQITHDSWSALFGASLSAFVPIFLSETLNALSVYSLALPLFFFALYCLLRLKEKFYLWGFLVSVFLLSLTHPLSFLFVLVFLLYFFLLAGGTLKIGGVKYESFLVSLFLVFLVGFVIYKKAFFSYGPRILWQNAPLNIFTDTFRSLNLLDLSLGVGFLPLILGVIGIYYGISREGKKSIYLFSSLSLAILVLLFFRWITISVGLMLLGLSLSVLASFAVHFFFKYLTKTHFALFKRFFVFGFLVLFLVFSFYPSLQAARSLVVIDPIVLEDLEWARLNLPREAVVLGSVHEGNLIASLAERKTVIDTNFLLAPSPEERLEDVNRIYGGWSGVQSVHLVEKYKIDYVYVSPDTLALYDRENVDYLNETDCFKKEGRFYAFTC